MKIKVLVLPTYFPTKSSPLIGAQIQEQTELMSDLIDFRVLYCLPGMGWKRFLFHLLLKFFTGKSKYKYCNEELIAGSLNVKGVYYFSSPYLPEKINLHIRVCAYQALVNRLIKNGWRPDVIHARTVEYSGMHSSILAEGYSIPFLLTVNTYPIIHDNIGINYFKNYRKTVESANKINVVSEFVTTFLLSNNYKCNPTITGNWINEKIFTLKPDEKTSKIFTILNIGHTGFTKDWPTFFQAINKLIYEKNIRDIRVKLGITQVYDTFSKNYIPLLINEYLLTEYCEVFYEVPRSSINDFYHSGDVFLSTSVNETFGIATAEALICGIPVIATNNGGINDFLNERNGIKVPVKDIDEIVSSIISIKNKNLTFDKEYLRNSILCKYGAQAFRSKLLEVYKDVSAMSIK